jgi:hypothetical protein
MATKKPEPTFIVRMIAPDLAPDKVPFRQVSAALSAIQDLASGRDPLETRQVPEEQVIGLVNVRKGSALYSCISRSPEDARRNLRVAGQLLADEGEITDPEDGLAKMLKPIERLSEVAKSVGCRLEVALATRPKSPLFSVGQEDFAKLSTRLFLTGDTTIIGTIERAGGRTDMKCALSVPGRRRMLFCDVKTRKIVQRLGQHLYEEIAARGEAVWIHSSWHIYKFTIHDFTQPRVGDASKAIEELRKAGLNAWDKIRDPDKYIKGMRS